MPSGLISLFKCLKCYTYRKSCSVPVMGRGPERANSKKRKKRVKMDKYYREGIEQKQDVNIEPASNSRKKGLWENDCSDFYHMYT